LVRSRRDPFWSIRFDVFVSGAVVMALELVGSRLLAPVYGDSIFVWGSLIGIVMTSLSVGYFFGGRLADRQPSFVTFSLIIFSAGLFTLLIPSTSSMVLEVVSYSGLGERYGPVLSSILLLAIPTTLLGMVSPYAIRLATDSLVKVGGISGSLYSISTAGSICGTFFTVFALIPAFNVRSIILSLGVVLVAASLIGLAWGLRVLSIMIIVVMMVPPAFLGGSVAIRGGTIVYQKDTPYNTLTVVDNEERGVRTIYLNNMPHSAMYLNGSNSAVFTYTDYFNLALVFNTGVESVLFIGGGGFSGPKQFLEYYPDVNVDVVEIDPQVVKAARDYFNVSDDPRLRVFVDDGRAFLGGAGKYDLVVLDAYSKTYVPFHLMTLEFFEALDEHLEPDGILVSNLISSLIGDTSDLLRAEYKTVNLVFPQVYLFHTRTSLMSQVQNIILIAAKTTNRQSVEDLTATAMEAPERSETLVKYSKTLFESEVRTEDLPVLTDDYAPVVNLLNPVTQAPYEGGEAMHISSSLNPLLIAGLWVIALASLYVVSTMVGKGFGIAEV
jgi:spermidine synthase